MLRLGILFFLILLVCTARGQVDSVLLKAVEVYGIPEEKYLAGSTIEKLDSAVHRMYNGNHLGEILAFQFPVYFRGYGNGMISGLSMRGTAVHHTAVLWNGININSFSLGQADFSILPATAFSQVKVHTGGGSSPFGSGAFGGTVLLQSEAIQNEPLDIKQEVGSFGRYFTSVKASFKHRSFASSTSLYHLQSENDFLLPDDTREKNAAFTQRGIVQHFQYELSPIRSVSLDYWFHDADREVQGTSDEQQDRNHRLVLSYQQNNRHGLLKAGVGMVDDRIIFNGNQSEVLRWVAFVNHQYSFGNNWNVQASVDWNHIIGKIEEYGGEPVEDRTDLTASLQKEFRWARISLNLRQPFVTDKKVPLLPYLGTDIFLFQRDRQLVQWSLNASRNFRVPTFNDRYWRDLGREDLLSETSYAMETSFLWRYESIKTQVSGFYQLVDEWIQWIPGTDGVFRPENTKQVSVRGLETSVESAWKHGSLSQNIKVSYQLTQSITEKARPSEASSIGKQLIYTPVHTASGFVITNFKTYTASAAVQYSGKRFTEASNSPIYALRPFALTDVSVGKMLAGGRHLFNLQLTVKNIFNVNYQLYSGRAMPGRHYNFQIAYKLKNKQL